MKRQVDRTAGTTLKDGGASLHGYRQFSGQLGKGVWVWLSANRVRRGFVRKGETDYKTLSKQLPELVDRFFPNMQTAVIS